MKSLLHDELSQVGGGDDICSCAYEVCDGRVCNREYAGSVTTLTDCRHAAAASIKTCKDGLGSNCRIEEICDIFGNTSTSTSTSTSISISSGNVKSSFLIGIPLYFL